MHPLIPAQAHSQRTDLGCIRAGAPKDCSLNSGPSPDPPVGGRLL